MNTYLKAPKAISIGPCLIIGFLIVFSISGIGFLLSENQFLSNSLLFSSGWFFWTFFEYSVHRFFMHELIVPQAKKDIINHRYHHRNPQDIKINLKHRLFILLIISIVAFFAFQIGGFMMNLLGVLVGLSNYAFLHYLLHRPIGGVLLPRVQRNHILHHSIRPNHGFSFSTVLWDWLFNTLPPKSDIVTKKMMEFYFQDLQTIKQNP